MKRRQFLQASAAGLIWPAAKSFGVEFASSKPRRYALIGTGWYGKSAMFRMLQVEPVEVVALCDVDQQMLAEAAGMVAQRQASKNKPRTYGDYRELLKQEQPDIVQVSTPDHWHCLPMIAAVEAGADVYVEKPISVDAAEGRAMLTAARKNKRVVQVGMQRRSTPHLIEARDTIIREGKLGKVGLVEIYCYYHMRSGQNPPDADPPEYLDFDMWTGPAPLRPFNPMMHPRGWRAFMEYGNGIVGDMCVHLLDTVRWMLGLGWPKRVTSAGGIFVQKDGKSNIADTQTATFEYDRFNAVWQHRTWGLPTDPDYPWAMFIHGEKGVLKASTMRADFIPHDKQAKTIHFECLFEREQYPEDLTEDRIELNAAPATRRHMLDFLAAIERRGRPVADIEQGHISTASCILANLAVQAGRALTYDPVKREVTGDAEATALLRRAYRKPWQHPEPDGK